MAAILNFPIFHKNYKTQNCLISKTVWDGAISTKFLTRRVLALTFISFSGRFVFAMQKHYSFFCERSSSCIIILYSHIPCLFQVLCHTGCGSLWVWACHCWHLLLFLGFCEYRRIEYIIYKRGKFVYFANLVEL